MGNVKTILLTGATGYLGSKLAEAFLSNGYNVVVLKRKTSDTMRIRHILPLIKCYNVDDNGIQLLFNENVIDCVVHTAAAYGRKGEALSEIYQANLVFPLFLFENAVKYKVKYFINTGTSLPADLNAYSLSKNQFASILKMYQQQINVININLEYFYGPGDDDSKFITHIIRKLFSKAESIDLSEGTQFRDFIYIKDVVTAYLLLLEKLPALEKYLQISLGSGKARQLKEIVECIKTYTNSTTKLNFGAIAIRTNEIMYSEADINFLTNLGWVPRYALESGLMETIELEKSLTV